MTTVPLKIEDISKKLEYLKSKPSYESAKDIILDIVDLVVNNIKSLSTRPFRSNKLGDVNKNWFVVNPLASNRPYCDEVLIPEGIPIDFRFYWLKKVRKLNISACVNFSDNYEDSPTIFSSKNIGVDFIINEKVDTIYVILSEKYKLRILELNGKLSLTQIEIFHKWLDGFDFQNKSQIHQILWKSFDLKSINQSFYKEIEAKFRSLVTTLKRDGFEAKVAEQFTLRLLSRIVFCWFLRKKNIIKEDKLNYFSQKGLSADVYYKKILSVLFFSVLNSTKEERQENKVIDLETPYLNGGLFESRDIDQDNKLHFDNDYFDKLFEILNQYNFTTDESTSSYQQVAIDPEMLGKIFEELLGKEIRKEKGAFYTPREIVDYMCKETIKEYLKSNLEKEGAPEKKISEIFKQLFENSDSEFALQTKNEAYDLIQSEKTGYKRVLLESLENIKVFDPACGSGAFPIGIMQTIVSCYQRILSETKFKITEIKENILANSIYGSDIDPTAIEITRLRAWLSIVVDEEKDDIHPLPNLDFHFVCSNTLISLEKQNDLFNNTDLDNELKDIRNKYFNARTKKSKDELKNKYQKLTQGTLLDDKRSSQLKSFDPFKYNKPANFFDSEYMFGINGFDIVIGNPPYIDNGKIKQEEKDYYNNNFLSAISHYDLFIIFYEQGLKLCKKKGVLAYITSNKWLAQKYGFGIRKLFLFNKIRKLINFGSNKIFDTASVDTSIVIVEKSHDFPVNLNEIKLDNFNNYDFDLYYNDSDLLDINNIIFSNIGTSTIIQTDELNFNFSLTKNACTLINKININSIRLDSVCYITLGAVIHDKNGENTKKEFLQEKFKIGLKPYLEGKDVLKWQMKNPSKFLDYKPQLHREPRFKSLFENEKIVCIRTSSLKNPHRFALDNGSYIADSSIIVINYNLVKNEISKEKSKIDFKLADSFSSKYLLALLNSKLLVWFFFISYSDGLHFYPRHLKLMPIKNIPLIEQKPFINLVDQILILKKQNKDADIKNLESQIDQLVYKLYNLTPEEIEIIENFSKK